MTPEGWAAAIIARGRARGPIPRYGDDAWQCLEPSDPRAAAAVAVAAECWRQESDPARIAERLREELDAEDRAVLERIRRTSADVAGALDWKAEVARPALAELRCRRGEERAA